MGDGFDFRSDHLFHDFKRDHFAFFNGWGVNRVDVARLAALAGEPVGKADADFVRRATGYAIGGVPPFGYPSALRAFLDEYLLAFDTVWAAAGGPHSVFEIAPSDLRDAMGVEPVALKPA